MRKLKIGRILTLFVVLILVVTASVYCIRTFFRQDEIIEEKSYYDLDLFSMENGWMTYKDSSYKSLTGIDVSSHNQYIDWYSVKQDGIDFAMIRVGYRGAQEGILHEDAYFNTNMQAAIQNKIKVGAYFFSSAITEDEIDEEVNMVLNEIRNYKIDMPIVFDMEEFEKGGRIDNLTQEQRTNLALRFCGKIKKAGYDPMIYGNMTWLYQNYDFEKISEYPIWLASYSSDCPMEDKFEMWQYSNIGQVNGVEGDVDINIYIYKRNDMIDFEKFEKQCDEIREINAKYIEEFVDELSKKGFVDKTIKRHYENVDFYLNTYLLRENALTMENGCKDEYLSDFFGYFFIRKCMWSTPDTVKSTIASLKKFYRFMYESNRLSKEDYEEFMDTIRVDKEYWIDCCSKYNDGISEW